MKPLFFFKTAIIRKTLIICNRQRDEKQSVKILSKSVQNCGRSCINKKWMYRWTYGGRDGQMGCQTDGEVDTNIRYLLQYAKEVMTDDT